MGTAVRKATRRPGVASATFRAAKRDWKLAIFAVALVALFCAVAFNFWGRAPSSQRPDSPGDTAALVEIPARPSIVNAPSESTTEPADVVAMREEIFDVAEQLVREIPLPDSWCLLGTVHHLYANNEVAVRIWQ